MTTNLFVFFSLPVPKLLQDMGGMHFLSLCWMRASLAISQNALAVSDKPWLSFLSLAADCLCLESFNDTQTPFRASEKNFQGSFHKLTVMFFHPCPHNIPMYHFLLFIPHEPNSLFLGHYHSTYYELLIFVSPRSRGCLASLFFTTYFLKGWMASRKILSIHLSPLINS